MGNSGSSSSHRLDRALAQELPEDERYFGLDNFGNTCYCNSVLQALYFCAPFRRALLQFHAERAQLLDEYHFSQQPPSSSTTASAAAHTSSSATNNNNNSSGSGHANGGGGGFRNAMKGLIGGNSGGNNAPQSTPADGAASSAREPSSESDLEAHGGDSMLVALSELFHQISTQKKRTGSLAPKAFIATLRNANELFAGYMHQDAHEFLNFLLNDIAESAQRHLDSMNRMKQGLPPRRALKQLKTFSNSNIAAMDARSGVDADAAETEAQHKKKTFVQELFEGLLTNEVRCLCCESVTTRDEAFLDLSVDVEQNSSLSACLRSFSSMELLRAAEKFRCETCGTLQEAQRRMRVKTLPRVLAVHLKRFKFVESLGKFKKLSYRVVFPLELRLTAISTSDAEHEDRLYELFAVVVHVGSGPNHGHYVSLIKSSNQWLLFDDDCVEPKDESELQDVFGLTHEVASSTETGYILFYSSASASQSYLA